MALIQVYPGDPVEEAAGRLQPGDTLLLKPGIHYGGVYVEASDIAIVGEEAVLENTMPVGAEWTIAEDSDNYCSLAGQGVWKIHCPNNVWELLDAQGVNHHRLDYHYCHSPEPHNYYITAWQAMIFEDGARPNYDYGADWWTGIEALFVWDQSTQTLYLKYRDGRRPAADLRYSSGPASHQSYPEIGNTGVYLWNARRINIIGLEIRGNFNGVSICRSSDVNIEGCSFGGFDIATRVQDDCLNVRIHDNYFNKNTLGINAHRPISKMSSVPDDPDADYRLSVTHQYYMHKFWITLSDSGQGCAMGVRNGWNESSQTVLWPKNIKFHHNEAEGCTYIVDLAGGDGVEIYRNYFHNMIDIGFQRNEAARNVSIHDNWGHEAGYCLMRWHRQDQEAGDNYVYNNCVADTDLVCEFIAITGYVQPDCPSPLRIAFYHNSFSGGRGVWQVAGTTEMRGFLAVNNLINNGSDLWIEQGTQNGHWGLMGGFDYNAHCGPQQVWGDYVGEHNIYNMPEIWPINQIEKEFLVPAGHVTKGRGVDITKSFVVGGRTWGPLPGFEEGYAHDIGYIERKWEEPVAATIMTDTKETVPGGVVTVSWTGASDANDWIAGFKKGAPNDQYFTWCYTNGQQSSPTQVVASGSHGFTMPTEPGEYEFRLYYSNSYTLLAKTESIVVSEAEPPEEDLMLVFVPALVPRDTLIPIGGFLKKHKKR